MPSWRLSTACAPRIVVMCEKDARCEPCGWSRLSCASSQLEQTPADARAAPSASAPNDIDMGIQSSPKRPRDPAQGNMLPADARAAPSASEPNDTVMDIHESPKRPREASQGNMVSQRATSTASVLPESQSETTVLQPRAPARACQSLAGPLIDGMGEKKNVVLGRIDL
eukprot:scaffold11172_cov122-Isochrysis_galbana.AAC.1